MAPGPSPTHVPNQYYGYSLQCTHFVYLLLNATPGTVVSLEVFEDLATHDSLGTVDAVQTKSGHGTNPVSDRSPELWKTIANWIDGVRNGELPFERCFFEIHTGKVRTGPIVSTFAIAANEEVARKAYLDARERLFGKAPHYRKKKSLSHSLSEYVLKVFDESNTRFAIKIIEQFKLTHGSGKAFADLLAEFKIRLIEEEIAEDVLLHGLGWVKKRLDEQIEMDQPATLVVDDFRHELLRFRSKLKGREYLPSLAGTPTSEQMAESQLRTFVKQLHLIEWDDEKTLKAISDYLSTKANIVAYSERGYIQSSSVTELESSLVRLWSNLKEELEIESRHDAIRFGQLLALRCLRERRRLEGIDVPDDFVPGCFHILADVPEIGWHPNYRELLSGDSNS